MSVKTYSNSASGNVNIATNFKIKEFACKNGTDEVLIDSTTIDFLQKARTYFGVPLSIVSGYRTVAYNKSIGGASSSYHCQGQAVDHHTNSKVPLIELAKFYESIGVLGIIVYPNSGFLHIDSRLSKYFAVDNGYGRITTKSTFEVVQPPIQNVNSDSWVSKVQQEAGVIVDGIAGPETLGACGVLKKGSNGNLTKLVQEQLGFTNPDNDGIFGPSTVAGVKLFQEQHELIVDGIVGLKTWRALLGV